MLFKHKEATTFTVPPNGNAYTSSVDKQGLSRQSHVEQRVVVETPTPMQAAATSSKEAKRIAREAEKQRRALMERRMREQARAVMQKRAQIMKPMQITDLGWNQGINTQSQVDGPKQTTGAVRTSSSTGGITAFFERLRITNKTVGDDVKDLSLRTERSTKAQQQGMTEDRVVTPSYRIQENLSKVSLISFASVESDPRPSRPQRSPDHAGEFDVHHFQLQLDDGQDSRTSLFSYKTAKTSFSSNSSSTPISVETGSTLQRIVEISRSQTISPRMVGL